MRMLVLSKLAIEDSSFISVDAERIQESATESEWLRVDLPDSRPTPEEVLIKKEAMWQMDSMAEDLLTSLKKRVRNKPQRYRKLLRVVWHCYFDPSSPSQTSVARMMGISNSLVSHYRKIFDDFIQGIELSDEEGVMLDGALSARLSAIIWDAEADRAEKAPAREYPSPFISPAKPLVVVASVASPGRT